MAGPLDSAEILAEAVAMWDRRRGGPKSKREFARIMGDAMDALAAKPAPKPKKKAAAKAPPPPPPAAPAVDPIVEE